MYARVLLEKAVVQRFIFSSSNVAVAKSAISKAAHGIEIKIALAMTLL
jgi:hypothetical protein